MMRPDDSALFADWFVAFLAEILEGGFVQCTVLVLTHPRLLYSQSALQFKYSIRLTCSLFYLVCYRIGNIGLVICCFYLINIVGDINLCLSYEGLGSRISNQIHQLPVA